MENNSADAIARMTITRSQYFKEAQAEIAAENLVTMQVASLIGFVATLFFFAITPHIITDWVITKEYYAALPLLAIFVLFASFYRRQEAKIKPLTVEVACAVYYTLLLLVFIGISVFPYPEVPQIYITICFMFMPALLIQRPLVNLLLMLVSEAIFITLAMAYKTPVCVQHDIFNSVAGMVFALIIMETTIRLRVRDYNARMMFRQLSMTDALTGLLNKVAFEENCRIFLQNRPGAAIQCALLVIDLDDFKNINDSYGHPCGDEFLATVGAALRKIFRHTDLVGRIGGDEFCVLMRDVVSMDIIENKIEQIQQHVTAIAPGGVAINSTCSVGGAVVDTENMTYGELFKMADAALYEVKNSVKGRYLIRRA